MMLPMSLSYVFYASLSGWLGESLSRPPSTHHNPHTDRTPSRAVEKTCYPTPYATLGSALGAIGTGLLTTFTPSTGASKWIGYQILIGAGRGMVLQMVSTASTTPIPFAFPSTIL